MRRKNTRAQWTLVEAVLDASREVELLPSGRKVARNPNQYEK